MIAAIVAIPIAAVGIYLLLGSPQQPDMPLAARLSAPPDEQDVAALIARVESHLASNPDDGRGWELIAPIYQRLGRADDSVRAFANAMRLLGSTAQREADLGEAMVRANDGIVTAEARQAFDRSLALDPQGLRPRFFLALALSQEGKKTEALAAWHALLAEAPAGGAPWADIAKEAVARLEGVAPSASPGPSAAEVEAAGEMTPGQRMAMIGGMVDSLAARLGTESTDADGWARLIRSYMVLGRKDDALAALAKARTALSADRDKLAIVEAEAKTQGILE
jgi:cytochrome c-type biogenesis protein CcmH